MNVGFRMLHPFTGFIFYSGLTLMVMLFRHPFFLLTIILSMIITNFFYDYGKQLKRSIPFLIFIAIVIIIMNPIISQRGANLLFHVFGHRIMMESFLYGITMALSLLGILIVFIIYQLDITSSKFLYLFSKVTPQSSLLAMLSIRFVPLLKRRLSEIEMVQYTRGISVKKGKFTKRIKDGMLLLKNILTYSLEEGLQTADSMKARGYDSGKRSSYVPYKITKTDYIILAILLSSLLLSVIFLYFGYGKLTFYPQLETIYLSVGDWLAFINILIYANIVNVIEGSERLKWR